MNWKGEPASLLAVGRPSSSTPRWRLHARATSSAQTVTFGACWPLSIRPPCAPAHARARAINHTLVPSPDRTCPAPSPSPSWPYSSPGSREKWGIILFSWQTPGSWSVGAVVLGMLLKSGQNSAGGGGGKDNQESLGLVCVVSLRLRQTSWKWRP